MKGEDLALPPVPRRHVHEHPQRLPVGGLGDKSRIIQGIDQFSQTGHPETVVPGKKRPGRRLVGGRPQTNVHRTNVTATEKRTMIPLVREEPPYSLPRLAILSRSGRTVRPVRARGAIMPIYHESRSDRRWDKGASPSAHEEA